MTALARIYQHRDRLVCAVVIVGFFIEVGRSLI